MVRFVCAGLGRLGVESGEPAVELLGEVHHCVDGLHATLGRLSPPTGRRHRLMAGNAQKSSGRVFHVLQTARHEAGITLQVSLVLSWRHEAGGQHGGAANAFQSA